MKTIIVDPVTRVSGLLRIEVDIDKNKIVDARAGGNQFRGFEDMFKDRPPFDIISLAPRLCGICSTHHALTSVLTLEDAMNVVPDYNGMVARDIANGFEFLQNHLRQIYIFTMPDYIDAPEINPLFKVDRNISKKSRVPKEKADIIRNNYYTAIELSRDAHRAIATLAGKAPHCHGIFIGGITTNIDIQHIDTVRYTVTKIKDFVTNKMIEDVFTIAKYYKEYYKLGRGYGNFMDYGVYDKYEEPIKYSTPAVLIDGKISSVNFDYIKEDLTSSWLNSDGDEYIPVVDTSSSPDPNKKGAYSWVTAPRYKGHALEGGPLARMTINGYYNKGISSMDRIVARALETLKICESIELLLNKLKIQKAVQQQWKVPVEAKAIGASGAARGGLAHWIHIKNGKIEKYAIIPPSNWNLSPTDNNEIKGPVEHALIGTEINDIKNPVEIGRIVRSFDPCLNCAAHVTTSNYKPIEINIL